VVLLCLFLAAIDRTSTSTKGRKENQKGKATQKAKNNNNNPPPTQNCLFLSFYTLFFYTPFFSFVYIVDCTISEDKRANAQVMVRLTPK
jgi:hypothetical protein